MAIAALALVCFMLAGPVVHAAGKKTKTATQKGQKAAKKTKSKINGRAKLPTRKIPPVQKEYTLEECVELALAYSPKLSQSRSDVSAAQYGEKEAFTQYLPTMGIDYTWNQVNQPTALQGTHALHSFSPRIQQPVFTGFRLDAEHRLAELGIDLAEVNLELTRLDVILSAKESYFSHLQAMRNRITAGQQVEQLKAQLKNAKDFYEVGIQPINEVLKVQVELANAQQDEVKAINNVLSTRAELARLIGFDVDHDLKVKDILAYSPTNLEYLGAKHQARAFRPELKANEVQLKQADQNIKRAQSEYWPSVSLQLAYSKKSDSADLSRSDLYPDDVWSATTAVSWNFWEWGRTRHKVSGQRAAKTKLEFVRRQLEDQVDLQVKQAYLYLKESEINIKTNKTAVTQAEENYRITQERYREQLTTNTEVLDAQSLLTRARNNYNNALATYNIAWARLMRAIGHGYKPIKTGDKAKGK